MNIFFINANLYGHINPTLGLVKELVSRGHKVYYFCSEEFSEKVRNTGAEWIGYSKEMYTFLGNYHPSDRHPFYMLMEYMLLYDEQMLPEILQFINSTSLDLVICDSYFGGACFLQKMIQIPVVCSHSSFAMSHILVPDRMLVPGFHSQLDNCYKIMKRICKKYKINEPTLEQMFLSKGERNIVYTIRSFNGDESLQEPEYLFNGVSIDQRNEDDELNFTFTGTKKIIYISLGSVNTDLVDFYRLCILAFRNTDYFVFLSIGKKTDINLLGEIPKNFIVKSFLPQLKILEKADVFVSHAGFNSVNEALYFGVPMLALPLVNDQQMIAKQLTTLQLGITDNMKTLSAEDLLSKVQYLLNNEVIKERCLQFSAEMNTATGLSQTVDNLEKYINSKKEKNIDGTTK